MVCKTENYWGFGMRSLSGVVKTGKRNVSEIVPSSGELVSYSIVPLTKS
jgi:hypothetical protein